MTLRILPPLIVSTLLLASAAAPGGQPDLASIQARAAKGDHDAEFLLGRAYARGEEGVRRDDAKAVEWFRKAAEQGDPRAENNLGGLYLEGRGVTQDAAQGAAWIRKAADQGAALAQETLGQLYAHGSGVPQDDKLAEQWYRKAAEQGLAKAQADLGGLYYFGAGNVPKDQKQAAVWIAKAAAQGDAWAQNTLGVCYENGFGVEKDAVKAARWYQKAARQGNAKAQSNLGQLYAEGAGGLKQNWAEAYAWLTLSASGGEITASHLLTDDRQSIDAAAEVKGRQLAAQYESEIAKVTAPAKAPGGH